MIKCVHTEQHGERVVRVEYNDSVDEYRCRLFVYGESRPQADYFTDDRDDAVGTAKLMTQAQPTPAPATEPKTLTIFPSWEAIVPVLVEVAANGQSEKARKEACDELLRLARTVDKYNEQARRGEERALVAYAIAYGNPVEGFTFVGPFDDRDDAVTHAEFNTRPDEWWIVEMTAPDQQETKGE